MKLSRAAWVRALPKGARARVVAHGDLVDLQVADGQTGGNVGLQAGAAPKLAERLLNVAHDYVVDALGFNCEHCGWPHSRCRMKGTRSSFGLRGYAQCRMLVN